MGRHEILTSPANPLLKDVGRAIARGGLTSQGSMVAGTPRLLEEAVRSGLPIRMILASESAHGSGRLRAKSLPLTLVADALFRKLDDAESSQGVIALVSPPTWTLERTIGQAIGERALMVVLDGVQDPGNAGAIVRAAEAFGATGVLFLKGTVSPFNPKTLRASAGSLFRLPFVHNLDATAARAALDRAGVDLYAAMPAGSKSLADANLKRPCAIAIGSEGRGVGEPMRRGAIGLSIPTAGVESLNAAVAAGIVLYEARRQRAERT
jgi:TrmH family RNA methyltransferase